MKIFELKVSKKAQKQIEEFKKFDSQSYKKIQSFFYEISEHPTSGTGKPEQLKGNLAGYWSRRINKKDRLIYEIKEKEIFVLVLSAKGHYNDK